jgi:hypothetical protein
MAHKLLNVSLMIGAMALSGTLHAQGRGMRLLGTQAGRPGKVVKGAPYSADVSNETTRKLADGNTIHQTSSGRVYRDSEGRSREEPSLQALGSAAASGSLPQLAFIYDPVASVSYVLNLASHTATRTVWPQVAGSGATNVPNRQARPEQANMKKESLGTQVFGGLVADVTRTTQTIPAGQIGNTQAIAVVSERWYSPDLQVVLFSKRSDPRSGDTVYQLTNINRSEPAAALFSVPADFQVSDAKPQTRFAGGPR